MALKMILRSQLAAHTNRRKPHSGERFICSLCLSNVRFISQLEIGKWTCSKETIYSISNIQLHKLFHTSNYFKQTHWRFRPKNPKNKLFILTEWRGHDVGDHDVASRFGPPASPGCAGTCIPSSQWGNIAISDTCCCSATHNTLLHLIQT